MSYDMEKARDVAGFMIVHNCYGGERFADTLAEVERLRADLRNCSAYVGIGPGEGDLPIPERVRRTVNRLNGSVHRYEQKILAKDVQIRSLKTEETNLTGQIEQLEAEIERMREEMENYGDDYVCQMKSKDARIAELEEALAEYQRLGKTIAGKVPCLTLHGDCGRCSAKMREVCGALEQIAGGKIGPDAKQHDHTAEFFRPNESPAKSWQITDERFRAIRWAEEMAGDCKAGDVLRAMLEAGQ